MTVLVNNESPTAILTPTFGECGKAALRYDQRRSLIGDYSCRFWTNSGLNDSASRAGEWRTSAYASGVFRWSWSV